MEKIHNLKIGDYSDNGQIIIIDEDKLCYLVRSTSRGASGLRTISKALLKEFVDFVQAHPEASPRDCRDVLSGGSEIDKYEYGYDSTLLMMAKMVLGIENVKPLHISRNKAIGSKHHISPLPDGSQNKAFYAVGGYLGNGQKPYRAQVGTSHQSEDICE